MSNPLIPNVPEKTLAEKLADSRKQREGLDRLEATTGNSGAIPSMPKTQLLAASPEEAKHPDLRYRWVNVRDGERVEARQRSGYVRVPMAEGGRQVGNLARFAIPRAEYDRRVAQIDEMGKRRLSAHKTEVENIAIAVAKELRDNHGINVNAENILIKEG